MILVDLEVPSVERNYQFSLEEHSMVEMLIAEIAEMICQKEHCVLQGSVEEMQLCSKDRKKILDRKQTLSEQGITDAGQLMLV